MPKRIVKNALVCGRCGKCCSEPFQIMWTADSRDLARWKRQNRTDILYHVKRLGPNIPVIVGKPNAIFKGKTTCPFLTIEDGKHGCSIQKTKPAVCKGFICEQRLQQFRKSLQ